LGTAGYGSRLHREWYTKTAAHSTFAIGGASQSRTARGTAEMGADGLSVAAKVTDAYPGATAARAVRIDGNIIYDELTVECENETTIDWFFHARGECTASAVTAEGLAPEGIEGREWIEGASICEAPYVFTWTLGDKSLTLKLETEGGANVWLIRSPDNPGNLRRYGAVARASGRKAAFKAVYEIKTSPS